MREYEYTVTKRIDEQTIRDLIIDVVEMGEDWIGIVLNKRQRQEYDNAKNNQNFIYSEWIGNLIIRGEKIKIVDTYGEVEPLYELSLDRILQGIKMNAEDRSWDSDLENGDAITEDCIMQYAIFDEVIFG